MEGTAIFCVTTLQSDCPLYLNKARRMDTIAMKMVLKNKEICVWFRFASRYVGPCVVVVTRFLFIFLPFPKPLFSRVLIFCLGNTFFFFF